MRHCETMWYGKMKGSMLGMRLTGSSCGKKRVALTESIGVIVEMMFAQSLKSAAPINASIMLLSCWDSNDGGRGRGRGGAGGGEK